MEEIKRQVNRAQRRMVLEQFLTIVAWSLFASLLVGAVGLAIPKIWALSGIDREAWMWGWIPGSAAAGLLVAIPAAVGASLLSSRAERGAQMIEGARSEVE